MVQIILLAAGIYILAKGRINFSKNRELVKPNSLYIGGALAASGVLMFVIGFEIPLILAIVTIIASFFLSRKIETPAPSAPAAYGVPDSDPTKPPKTHTS